MNLIIYFEVLLIDLWMLGVKLRKVNENWALNVILVKTWIIMSFRIIEDILQQNIICVVQKLWSFDWTVLFNIKKFVVFRFSSSILFCERVNKCQLSTMFTIFFLWHQVIATSFGISKETFQVKNTSSPIIANICAINKYNISMWMHISLIFSE